MLAHLLKNCFQIFGEAQEYTNEYDNNTIKDMFPEVEIVHLRVVSHKDIYKAEEEFVSIRFNIKIFCEILEDKYKMFYCFKCNKMIYSDCSKNENESPNRRKS